MRSAIHKQRVEISKECTRIFISVGVEFKANVLVFYSLRLLINWVNWPTLTGTVFLSQQQACTSICEMFF